MIIYGTRSTELAKELISEKCGHCGKQNTIDLHLFQKYAHVFWIPFFALSKTGVSQCDHCKEVLKAKEMPQSISSAYSDLKSKSKTPLWTFSGLALLVVLIFAVVIISQRNDAKNAQLVLAPQVNDIFEIRTTDNQYTIYKVAEVQKDSVFVYVNNFETNKMSGLNDLKKRGTGAYADFVVPLAKIELKRMLEAGEIMDIERN
ncbi:MAG: hypothetical protein H7Y31_17645 [Chitinophagaceae bacterium]|nr:hypothetical protein [Chitinophagaceae bacterium]